MKTESKSLKINVNDINISYLEHGPADGQVLVFIHGYPFNKSTWAGQMDLFQNDYRTIAYDVRGHGETDAGEDTFSIPLFVEDLIGLLDTLGIETAVVCGLSMGGFIALQAMEKYPDRFDALILVDTNSLADTPEVAIKRRETIKAIHEDGVEKFADNLLKSLFAKTSFSTLKHQVAMVRDMIVSTRVTTLTSTLTAFTKREDTSDSLKAIKIPVMIVVGEEDAITPVEDARHMHKLIEESELHIVPHAGHLSNLENELVFNGHLRHFMASLASISV